MSLVGILTEGKNVSYLKENLKEVLHQNQIFIMNENNIKNLKNIKFQTVLIGKKVNKNENVMREIAQKADYLVINTDIPENLDLLNNLNLKIIAYGFNTKATITTSSVEDGKIMVCLQRTIENLNNEKIEPQEWQINVKSEEEGYAVMELEALKLIYKSFNSPIA